MHGMIANQLDSMLQSMDVELHALTLTGMAANQTDSMLQNVDVEWHA